MSFDPDVAEFIELQTENHELRAELQSCRARIAELEAALKPLARQDCDCFEAPKDPGEACYPCRARAALC